MTSLAGPNINFWTNHEGAPALFKRTCSSVGSYDLGNNTIGSSPAMNSFNGTGNDNVMALYYTPTMGNNSQVIKNYLGTALTPSVAYRLSFMVANPTSTATGYNNP